MSIAIEVATADLHSAVARRRVFDEATARAASLGEHLRGDYLTGPRLVGDLRGRHVLLEWDTQEVVPTPDPEAAALWVDRLWGCRAGRAILCFGHGGSFTDSGAYKFERFEQRERYDWPADRDRVLDDALAAAPTVDVYVSVLLHTGGHGRTQATALAGTAAWADVDGAWTADRERALATLGTEVWQVSSGARGGRHVYLPLSELVDPARLEVANQRLAVRLGADDGWSRTKVLRLPGTLNHKPRARGQVSAAVRWVQP